MNGAVEIINVISKKSGVEFDPITAGNISNEKIYHVSDNEPVKKDTLFSKVLRIVILILVILFQPNKPFLLN